jgi:DNA-binding transcriptional LysR family regulator
MDLRQLKTFQLAAATLSFTQTAAILNFAQSSVTAQIRSLEEELGAPLFDRIGRRVFLTAAGRQFLRYADEMLRLDEEARSAVAGHGALQGTLSIAAPETVFTYRIPPILRRFRDRFPRLRLHFQPMVDAESLQHLKDGTLDVAFLLQEPLAAGGLAVEALVHEPLVVVAPADHPLAAQEIVRPADLNGETILLTETGCGYRHLFERELARAGALPLARLEFTSVEAIKQCVIAGLGMAFLPEIAVRQGIEQGKLKALRWERSFQISTQVAWHPGRWLSPALVAFLEICRESLGISNPSA